ncbi:MAG TPA: hypothetical protein VKB54_21985 [Solirubrobacteraceae bacterium]|nr:hypothetical protein [Solirubrobacteraceae bacterium]
MARKVWVLDTSTKGTGATVVPLERAPEKSRGEDTPQFPVAKRVERKPAEKPAAPRAPRQFKVVDLVSSETLTEGADMRATVDLLKDVHSVVDVHIFVWDDEADRWRLLTLDEQRALWDASRR